MAEMAVRPAAPVRTPTHVWIVGTLALLWNAVGAFDYLATQMRLEFYMSNFTAEQLDYFYSFPAWADAAWALGVWGAFAGAIGLLMRRRWAVWAFALSIVGLVGTTLYSFVLTDGTEIMGTAAAIFSLVVWIIAILLLWYSWKQAQNGVLR